MSKVWAISLIILFCLDNGWFEKVAWVLLYVVLIWFNMIFSWLFWYWFRCFSMLKVQNSPIIQDVVYLSDQQKHGSNRLYSVWLNRGSPPIVIHWFYYGNSGLLLFHYYWFGVYKLSWTSCPTCKHERSYVKLSFFTYFVQNCF